MQADSLPTELSGKPLVVYNDRINLVHPTLAGNRSLGFFLKKVEELVSFRFLKKILVYIYMLSVTLNLFHFFLKLLGLLKKLLYS